MIKNEVETRHPDYNIVYVSAETFVNEFVNSVKMNTTEEFKEFKKKLVIYDKNGKEKNKGF